MGDLELQKKHGMQLFRLTRYHPTYLYENNNDYYLTLIIYPPSLKFTYLIVKKNHQKILTLVLYISISREYFQVKKIYEKNMLILLILTNPNITIIVYLILWKEEKIMPAAA